MKQLIEKSGGKITFKQYMAEVLYHPTRGYYTRSKERLGSEGDFVTAPEITSLFGELLALQMIEIWHILGSPNRFQLIEMGPGTGRLAEDILTTAKKFPDFYQALSYSLVEISQDFQKQQAIRLQKAGVKAKARWYDTLQSAGSEKIVGVILGNEFLDALPIHRVEQTAEGLAEISVQLSQGEPFLETTLTPLTAEISADYMTSRHIVLEEGTQTEIGLEGEKWVEEAGSLLERGVLLMIDYGLPQKGYYTPERRHGTVAGHLNHVRVDNPLDHPGEMDLTAHVNFTAMRDAGIRSGMHLLGYTTQGWFLMGLGILERLERLSSKEDESLAPLKEAVMRLILPEGMGETFKVLALGKGMDGAPLSGFRLSEQSEKL
ncbi:MAG: SAM-dependent methyltransferase [Magnetococcales bacterium]|nr:SAM-dependent methyltransferase [Magnetococcales bacterium]